MMEIDEEYNRKRKRDCNEEDWYPQVGIVWDTKLFAETSKILPISRRGLMVHSLISAYDLLRNMTILKLEPATDWDLSSFHSSDFINYMKSINDPNSFDEENIVLEHGLGYDCPPLKGIYDFICTVVGSTLTACRALIMKSVDIAINWSGGWHHAQRDEVEGFCYANDIVVAILEMQFTFNKILYLDLDVHHCNGVENCFSYTKKVVTVSLHQYETGFYPGTGDICDIGHGSGRYYTVNVPLREGISDAPYCNVFNRVLDAVLSRVKFDAVVVQCGADCLSGDSIGGFNLTPMALLQCLKRVLSLRKPTLILGGGGYNIVNTSKCWTYLTSKIVGSDLPSDIPDHSYFTSYGPDYVLDVKPNNRKDLNTQEYLNNVVTVVEKNCAHMTLDDELRSGRME